MNKRILLFTLLLFAIPAMMFAQSSGKIVGVIKDASSGEPLPGVNVSLEGTTAGAASDVDGYFVILNVAVGEHNVRASFIGYKDVLQQGIRVSAGVTSEVNFDLEETAIEGEAVVVTAVKPLVEKHVTQSVSLVTSEELENIPIRSFEDLVATQNSVVVQDDNIHIRGGRSEEVGYYLDGAIASNPLSNTNAVYVIKDAVEEFQVQAGGYTADLGNANSGIIRTELKTGSSDFHISLDVQTDKFADEGGTFLGTHSFRHHVFTGTASGPLGSENVRAFVAYENNFQGDQQRRFSEGYQFDGLIDSNPVSSNVIAGHPDTVDISYPDGFTPGNELDLHAVMGTLLFDFSPLKLRATGSYTGVTEDINDRPMLRILNERTQQDVETSMILSLKGTYVISNTSFLEIGGSMWNSELDREDSYFGNDWQSWYDSSAVAGAAGADIANAVFQSPYTVEPDYLLNGITFERNGDPRNFYRIQKLNRLGGTFDYVSQIGKHHELKIGGSADSYEIRSFSVRPSVISNLATFGVSSIDQIPAEVIGAGGRVDAYGYDNYGNEISDDATEGGVNHFGPKKPLFAAFYVTDKIEYNDLIINAGLRFDHFNTDDRRLASPDNPDVDPVTGYLTPESWEEVGTFQQISPRLGFSFPVSEQTVFYTQYGKFIQMPELNDLYFGSADYRDQIFTGGNFFLAPIGYGLEPIRTTAYEIGFRQELSSVAAIDIAGFYKNVKGQPTLTRIDANPSSSIGSYNIITNGDFATTQGLDLKLTLRRTNRLQAQMNYTFTSSEGTGSSETAHISAVEQGSARPATISPLDFAQKHVGSLNLDYRFGNDDGGAILENFGANALFSFNSGHPYTFAGITGLGQVSAYDAGVDYMNDTRSRVAEEAVGSSSTPWNFNIDLRLDKAIDLTEDVQATVYARVTNLLNTQNVINVYGITGNADDDGYISNPELSQDLIDANGGEDYVSLYNAINIVNGQSYWDALGRQLWSHPRQIFFGVRLSY